MRPVQLRCEYRRSPLGIDQIYPRLSWKLKAEGKNRKQKAYQILVSSSEENIRRNKGDLWNSGMVVSDQSINIKYQGKNLESRMICWWKVRIWDDENKVSDYSLPARWEMGLLDNEDWKANWISIPNEAIKKPQGLPKDVGCPCPFLRKSFFLSKFVHRARIYVTSLGLYELYLNGNRVSDEKFTPGWTNYYKRIEYQTYDVTTMLKQGNNAIGAILGDGWYAGNIAHVGQYQYGSYPLWLFLQLEVEYKDGSREFFISDESWKASTGPILFSDLLMGELYDARKEPKDWSDPDFDDASWISVKAVSKPNFPIGKLVAQVGPPIRETEELAPVEIIQYKPGIYIFDMGQNMVGRVSLKVSGPSGTKITLRFGEMLNDDGSLYTENLRTARQTDIYILRGEGIEVYEPRFTFHGFRYVEVVGYPGQPTLETITGKVINSDMPQTGFFECSSSMINQLQSNIVWSQRGNFLSVPTDCPQRNERMGWTGDAQIFARTACFNARTVEFFHKWMRDVSDAQLSSGAFTDVAPQVKGMGAGNAAWGDAGVIIPWTMYLCYRDKQIIEEHYDAMVCWIEYLKANSKNLLRPDKGFGDWLNVDDETPKDVLGTAYFAYVTHLLSKMAAILGKYKDAKKYNSLFENIRRAFVKAYVSSDGSIRGNTQTCYVLALQMELLPDNLRPLAAKKLVKKIEEKDGHLSTGFVGVSYLLPVLSNFGYTDVAYSLLTQDTYPSWGYSIKNGATTMWERWDSYTVNGGFGNEGMNSFNHYSLGSVGEWMYRYISGIEIDPENPGYKHIIIQPHIGGGLTWANGIYDSLYGRVVSNWKIEDDGLYLKVEIPPNTTATAYLPKGKEGIILEGGKPIEKTDGAILLKEDDEKFVLEFGSGQYCFYSR